MNRINSYIPYLTDEQVFWGAIAIISGLILCILSLRAKLRAKERHLQDMFAIRRSLENFRHGVVCDIGECRRIPNPDAAMTQPLGTYVCDPRG